MPLDHVHMVKLAPGRLLVTPGLIPPMYDLFL